MHLPMHLVQLRLRGRALRLELREVLAQLMLPVRHRLILLGRALQALTQPFRVRFGFSDGPLHLLVLRFELQATGLTVGKPCRLILHMVEQLPRRIDVGGTQHAP